MTPEELNKALSDRMETVMATHFPNAKKQGQRWYMGDLDGNEGSSCGVFRGRGGVFLATDKGETTNILGLLHRKLGLSWSETLAEAKKLCGVSDVRPVSKPAKPSPRPLRKEGIRDTPLLRYLNARGIKEYVAKKYRVEQIDRSKLPPSKHERRNDKYALFPYWDTEGAPVQYKWKGLEKDERGKTETGTTVPQYATLWGWHVTDENTREIIVAEGEEDAMSVAQMLPDIPALSLPNGASNLKWIENDYARLQEFETIYICTDMDEPGEKAAEQMAGRLGRARCRRVSLPEGHKDANEFLLSRESDLPSFKELLDRAETYDPAQLKRASQLKTGLLEEIDRFESEKTGNDFLWPDLPFRFRRGELTVVTGYPSHGKSQWLYQAVLHEMTENDRAVCIASYEIPAKSMLFNLSWMMHGHSPTPETCDRDLAAFEDRLWFIEGEEGAQTWPELKEDFTYAAKRFGCDLFVVDALLHVTEKGDAEGTDKVAKSAAKWSADSDVSTLLVAHADAKKRRSGDEIPEPEDILGGQGIAAAAHNVVAIWRNRKKEKEAEERGFADPEAPDGKIYVSKQRATGVLLLRDLWFDRSKRTFRLSQEEARNAPKPSAELQREIEHVSDAGEDEPF